MKTLNEVLTKVIYQDDYKLVPTGFEELDRILDGGLKPWHVTLVAGRPSMGKTAFLLDVAMHHAMTTCNKVAYFSFYESAEDIAIRILGKKTGAYTYSQFLQQMISGRKGDIEVAYSETKELPILMFDDPNSTALEIKEICESIDRLGMIIVDLNSRFYQDDYVKQQVLFRLTQVAVSLHIPVLCSCMVDRSVEIRVDNRPDFNSIGLVSVLADPPTIIALYRENYYSMEEEITDSAEAIVIPFVHSNRQLEKTARLRWCSGKLAFENDTGIYCKSI